MTKIRKWLIKKAVKAYHEAERDAPRRDEQLLRITRTLTPDEFQEYARLTVKKPE